MLSPLQSRKSLPSFPFAAKAQIRDLLRSNSQPPEHLPSTVSALSDELARYEVEISRLRDRAPSHLASTGCSLISFRFHKLQALFRSRVTPDSLAKLSRPRSCCTSGLIHICLSFSKTCGIDKRGLDASTYIDRTVLVVRCFYTLLSSSASIVHSLVKVSRPLHLYFFFRFAAAGIRLNSAIAPSHLLGVNPQSSWGHTRLIVHCLRPVAACLLISPLHYHRESSTTSLTK
ncbi:hypothetical protein C8R44DRAFT_880582 [Mycena epipterygia]|nr:hypothetical protein C8R44DRAFT_880582 [Mycena epipterygia]